MFFNRISAAAALCGAAIGLSACQFAGLPQSAQPNTKLRAPAPEAPPTVGRGGMYQGDDGCFVFEDRNGRLSPLTGSRGEPSANNTAAGRPHRES